MFAYAELNKRQPARKPVPVFAELARALRGTTRESGGFPLGCFTPEHTGTCADSRLLSLTYMKFSGKSKFSFFR